MSSPITIPYASTSSPGLYVPIHRRTPSSSSRTPSPSPSSLPPLSSSSSLSSTSTLPDAPAPAPAPAVIPGVYTPAELLLLSTSPLAKLSAEHVDALRALVPEVVRTRRQRKTSAWRARRPATAGMSAPASHTHGRTSSRGSHTSESEEDKVATWRRV